MVPTTHGSVLLGPTALDIADPGDRATDPETVTWILDNARRLVPATADAYVMKTFAANRPAGDEPHRLRTDARQPCLLHVTDRSAGVSISPAAAELALTRPRQPTAYESGPARPTAAARARCAQPASRS